MYKVTIQCVSRLTQKTQIPGKDVLSKRLCFKQITIQAWWHTPVIPGMWEAEVEGLQIQAWDGAQRKSLSENIKPEPTLLQAFQRHQNSDGQKNVITAKRKTDGTNKTPKRWEKTNKTL